MPCKGAVIRATKSCNSSRNIVALQVAERMLLVLTPYFLLRDFVARSRSSSYSLQQRKFVARRVVIRATFALQLATQQCCATSCTILLLILLHLKQALHQEWLFEKLTALLLQSSTIDNKNISSYFATDRLFRQVVLTIFRFRSIRHQADRSEG